MQAINKIKNKIKLIELAQTLIFINFNTSLYLILIINI